jgi:hypothetical protein
MSVKTHHLLTQIIYYGWILALATFDSVWLIVCAHFFSSIWPPFIAGLVGIGALLWLLNRLLGQVSYHFPAYCDAPGCKGRARPTWINRPDGKRYIRFRCEICGTIYDAGSSEVENLDDIPWLR